MVIAAPLSEPALNATRALELPAVATSAVGASGASAGGGVAAAVKVPLSRVEPLDPP